MNFQERIYYTILPERSGATEGLVQQGVVAMAADEHRPKFGFPIYLLC